MMDKQVDYVTFNAVVDGKTGEQHVELIHASYVAHDIHVETHQWEKIDPKRADPILTVFYEPKVDDDQADG